MGKFIQKPLLIVAAIFLFFPTISSGKTHFENNEDVFHFTQTAFQAQVAISEQERSLPEIHEILSPYFTENAKGKFLKENLFEENGKYFTLGTDFPIYYIPFFSYEKTEVITINDKLYVFEYFLKNDEGPVSYDSHYEGVLLEKENGHWKVAEFLNNISPEEMLKQDEGNSAVAMPIINEAEPSHELILKSACQMGFSMQPLTDFYLYGLSILFEKVNNS
ncbi:DUF3993 domain-containing protein [Bacillus sp. Bva_UNVM-123]|uniref:DUF3993 domain-containing protein n=1 Tax=Bacillus sp. Bva_UNVM-123 TaxID=2829798 RepID=UPI00391F4EAE